MRHLQHNVSENLHLNLARLTILLMASRILISCSRRHPLARLPMPPLNSHQPLAAILSFVWHLKARPTFTLLTSLAFSPPATSSKKRRISSPLAQTTLKPVEV